MFPRIFISSVYSKIGERIMFPRIVIKTIYTNINWKEVA